MTFRLTAKQDAAQHVFAGDATHIMLFGGSRSGKTFLTMRNIVVRALKAKGSRHAVFRQRFNAVKASVWLDTFPKVMQIAFAGVPYNLNKTDFFATFENGSELWFGGLDDKERAEIVGRHRFCKLIGCKLPTKLLENWLSICKDCDTKLIPVGDGNAQRLYGVFH